MSETKEKEKVTFEDMNLQVGSRIQLITYHAKKVSYYSSLIGYELDKYLFVKMPQENGYDVPIKVSERIEVRFFSGVSIYTFPSCVQFIYPNRRTFLELAFPEDINVIALRKDMRISLSLPITISHIKGKKLLKQRIVRTIDFSASGAMLRGATSLGEVGDELDISFSIKNKTTQQDMLIQSKAIIRNRRVATPTVPDGKPVYMHGIMFSQLDPSDTPILQNYIYEATLDGRQIS